MLDILGLGYSETKIKPYLKMAVNRIQLYINKKTTAVKHQKREVATLLAEQKDEKARIKVEHIIRDDFLIEAYEVIELLCDLLHERIRQITISEKMPPTELAEAVCSLIWAATYADIDELREVKRHLSKKFGPEYTRVAEENRGNCVNFRLVQKLTYKPPSRKLVNGYMEEIAKAYKVDWTPPPSLPEEITAELEDAPFGTPSGFSVAMAPGSGLTSAYSAPVVTEVPSAVGSVNGRKLNEAEQAEYDQFLKHQTGAEVYPAIAHPAVAPKSADSIKANATPPSAPVTPTTGPEGVAAVNGTGLPTSPPPPVPAIPPSPPADSNAAPASASAQTSTSSDPMEVMLARLAALNDRKG